MAAKCHFTMSFKNFFVIHQAQHTVIAQNTDNALMSCSTNILVPWAGPEGNTLVEKELSCLHSSATDLPYNRFCSIADHVGNSCIILTCGSRHKE